MSDLTRHAALAGAEPFLDWLANLMWPLESVADAVAGDDAPGAGEPAGSSVPPAPSNSGDGDGANTNATFARTPPLHVYTLPKRNASAPFFPPHGRVVILNLWHAARLYRWGKADLATTQATLAPLSARLKAAWPPRLPDFEAAAHEVLQWGGVARGNGDWIEANPGRLAASCQAIASMQGGGTFSEPAFRQAGARMNSGFTKIYAMLLDGFLMYDSRVAAAFALLLTIYASQGHPRPAFADELCVFSGRSGHRVADGFANRSSEARHARANLVANWVVDALFLRHPAVAAIWQSMVPGTDRFRTVEAALFMLGYDIGTHPLVRQQLTFGATSSTSAAMPPAIDLATLGKGVPFVAVPAANGFELRYGSDGANRAFVPDAFIQQVAIDLAGQEVAVGASRTDPSPGSLGDYLLANLSPTALASYVAPLLVWLGIAGPGGQQGHIRFP